MKHIGTGSDAECTEATGFDFPWTISTNIIMITQSAAACQIEFE